jgi:hypothetical protein
MLPGGERPNNKENRRDWEAILLARIADDLPTFLAKSRIGSLDPNPKGDP